MLADEADHDLIAARLRTEMMERAERGFRGWTRADGTYADGDGRSDYKAAFGLGWKARYDADRAAAEAAAASETRKTASGADPVEQALEWARQALEEEKRGSGSGGV